MAKRRPEFQLNHNNWDEEHEPEEGGSFQEATEGVLKNRIIRTAKRRLPRDQTDGGEAAKKTTSVFSGFSFDKQANNTTANSTPSTSKPMFSFGNASSTTPFSFSSSTSTAPTNSLTSSASAKNEKSTQFKHKLKELNKSVLNCIKGYVESQDLCILTPIFKDYEKYVKEMEDGENNKTDTTSSTISAATADSDAAQQFKFSFSSAKVSEASTSSSVAAVASAPTASNLTPAFSFGKPAAVAPNTFTGFSFASAVQQAAAKAPTTDDKTATANGGDKNDAGEEEESDEPPKVEFKAVVEDDSIYSKRCKLFIKNDAAFKELGTGTLFMKEVAGGDKVQLIVRADTNLGNILLNIIISKAVPATRNKNNLILVCIPTPDAKEQKPRQVLVRVKTEDDAIELLEEYKKHQK